LQQFGHELTAEGFSNNITLKQSLSKFCLSKPWLSSTSPAGWRSVQVIVSTAKTKPQGAKTAPIIIKAVLEKPLRAIAENAGKDSNEVASQVLKLGNGMGYDAATGEYVDMIKAGIIDPLKVVKTSLSNAVSVASMILTTEAVVTDIPEDKPKGGPGGGMPPMGGMDY